MHEDVSIIKNSEESFDNKLIVFIYQRKCFVILKFITNLFICKSGINYDVIVINKLNTILNNALFIKNNAKILWFRHIR